MQKERPKKIILWVHEDLGNKLPKKLQKLQGDFFEIRFSKSTSSHRKLVNTQNIFPDETVVTCDDDMIYPKNWLSKLYSEHQKNPTAIIANQTRCISYDGDKNLLPYHNWGAGANCKNPRAVLPIGAGGTLYPPNTLYKDVSDSNLFLKLTPKADDLWFKAMSLKNGTLSVQASNTVEEPIPILGSQTESLKNSNIKEDKNRVQWQTVADHYGLHDLVIQN